MNKIWIITAREYWTRVRKRSFLLTTLLAPVGFGLFFIAMFYINQYSEGEKQVAVLDESGHFDFKKKGLKTPSDKSVYFKFPKQDYQELKDSIEQNQFDILVRIPQNFDPQNPKKYAIRAISTKRVGMSTKRIIDDAIAGQVKDLRIDVLKVDREKMEEVSERITPDYEIIGEEGESAGYADAAAVLGIIMGFAIYISLFVYGTMVMKGVMEEKTNRIVEVITSSVKPFQLLISKIIGIGGVGITQYLLWIILIFFMNIVLGLVFGFNMGDIGSSPTGMEAQEIDVEEGERIIAALADFNFWPVLIAFLFYFLGGYLLYGALFAAVGSATNDDGDMQSLTFPITIPIIISIIIMMVVVNEPDSQLAVWSSIIPFSAPIVMPVRIAFYANNIMAIWWQLLLSVSFLIAGFLATTWLAAKIYRTGILMYGKKVNLREIGRWIFYS